MVKLNTDSKSLDKLDGFFYLLILYLFFCSFFMYLIELLSMCGEIQEPLHLRLVNQSINQSINQLGSKLRSTF